MEHKPCKDWLDKLMMREDELSLAEQHALEGHLQSCPACARERALCALLGALLRALPSQAFPAGLPLRLLQEMGSRPTADQQLPAAPADPAP
jgi:anti-sigma factor RsiW